MRQILMFSLPLMSSEFDYGNRDIAQYMKEEKILKQREAIAEDLFKTEKVFISLVLMLS